MPSRTSKSTASLRAPSRLALIALAAAAAWATPAHASEVVVVGATGTERVDDPFVPSRAETDLGPAPGRPRIRAIGSASGARAVGRALRRAKLTRSKRASYRRTYNRARSTLRKLRGARRTELAYVVRIARGDRARAAAHHHAHARAVPPAAPQPLLLGVQAVPGVGRPDLLPRQRAAVPVLPGPRACSCTRCRTSRRPTTCTAPVPTAAAAPASRSAAPGRRARRQGTPCRPGRLRRLLDELSALAVRRGKFIAWEYNFHFGGGSPPWMSGMAQSVAVVALGRAARTLKRPDYNVTAHNALGAFSTRRPTGVRTRGPMGGVHYLQYSFSPRLFIFNAFGQSLIGLYDYGRLAKDPVATALFEQAEPEARREMPLQRRGRLVALLVPRAGVDARVPRAAARGAAGPRPAAGADRPLLPARDPLPRLPDRPARARRSGCPPQARRSGSMRVRFSLSKLSVVELRIFKGRKMAFKKLATFRRGSRALRAGGPKSAGDYRVRIAAKELRTGRSLRGRDQGRARPSCPSYIASPGRMNCSSGTTQAGVVRSR